MIHMAASKRVGVWQTDALRDRYLGLTAKYPTSLSHTVEAQGLIYQARRAEARVEAGQAIALEPNDPEAHIAMAWALTIGGKPKEAPSFISAAMRLNPNYPSHYVLARGIALFAVGESQQV
jgi:adenylate cyclase